MIQNAINHFFGESTIKDVERARPTVGRDMIRFVLKELRAGGQDRIPRKGTWGQVEANGVITEKWGNE